MSTAEVSAPVVREVHVSRTVGMAGNNRPHESHFTFVFVGDRIYLRSALLCVVPEFGPAGWAPSNPAWRNSVIADLEQARADSHLEGSTTRVWCQRLDNGEIPIWPWPVEAPADDHEYPPNHSHVNALAVEARS